jgi:Helix-turn-helix domain
MFTNMTVNRNHPQAGAVNPANRSTKRAAYSPAEFAATCGRHPSWAYRLLYGGKIRALTDLGRILIPASELERLLSRAAPYNPQPRKPKTQQSSATIEGAV